VIDNPVDEPVKDTEEVKPENNGTTANADISETEASLKLKRTEEAVAAIEEQRRRSIMLLEKMEP
jgi:hypothetical protein